MSINRARTDIQRFTQADFGVDLVLTAPSAQVANVRGLASKHRLSINPETGLPINSPNIHFSVAEQTILEANPAYPVRNAEGLVFLKGHTVLYEGLTYKISENWTSDTTKWIVCIIDNYQ